MSLHLLMLGLALSAISGLPGLFLSRHGMTGQRVAAVLGGVGCALGLSGVGRFWAVGDSEPLHLAWSLPGGELTVGVDALSAFFLVPILLLSLLGHLYGMRYWRQTDHPGNGRKLRVFYGLLTCGMALLVLARDSIVFIFGWEIMALAAFFLVTTEDDKHATREAGWIYFVATHTSTLALFALFALMYAATGSYALAPLSANILTHGPGLAIFCTALFAFGLKAGLMPLHIWLPGAHAAAPSHVSALMSGVLIKMGIYGLVRITSLLPPLPVAWGGAVLLLGVISALLGVAYAIGQHDLKRLLAYHSIENIGIIVMGLGLAMMGRTLGRGDLVVLGMAGCLLHVWNHALFKSLLFLSAGAVVHAAHTREIDQLGGLAKTMPRTALAFLIGAVAICGLPPLNGFVSEWFLCVGLMRTLSDAPGSPIAGAAFAAPVLALVGALAAACFVKVYGAVFLGHPRSSHVQQTHDAPWAMLVPMAVLGVACFLIGLAPVVVAPVLESATFAWAPGMLAVAPRLHAWVPLQTLAVMGGVLLALLATAGLVLRFRLTRGDVSGGAVWGCGYVAPTARMQTTASSFAHTLVGLFAWALRPRRTGAVEAVPFPPPAHLCSDVPDVVLQQLILPPIRFSARLCSALRVLQQGQVNAYLLYIFVALVVLFVWGA